MVCKLNNIHMEMKNILFFKTLLTYNQYLIWNNTFSRFFIQTSRKQIIGILITYIRYDCMECRLFSLIRRRKFQSHKLSYKGISYQCDVFSRQHTYKMAQGYCKYFYMMYLHPHNVHGISWSSRFHSSHQTLKTECNNNS